MGETSRDISAFVLAGGKSTRMGVDKALVTFDGLTLLARALATVHGVSSDVRIVGDPVKFAAFGPVVEDIFRGCGPLGGIHTALRASEADLNVILAVDVPFVSAPLLQYLIGRARQATAASVTVPRMNEGWQPLCGVYRRDFADAAEKSLREGRYKIDSLFKALQVEVIQENELVSAGFSPTMFRNLNTQEELAKAVEENRSELRRTEN